MHRIIIGFNQWSTSSIDVHIKHQKCDHCHFDYCVVVSAGWRIVEPAGLPLQSLQELVLNCPYSVSIYCDIFSEISL